MDGTPGRNWGWGVLGDRQSPTNEPLFIALLSVTTSSRYKGIAFGHLELDDPVPKQDFTNYALCIKFKARF